MNKVKLGEHHSPVAATMKWTIEIPVDIEMTDAVLAAGENRLGSIGFRSKLQFLVEAAAEEWKRIALDVMNDRIKQIKKDLDSKQSGVVQENNQTASAEGESK